MAQRTELEVAPRTIMGKATKRLRKEGIIPANIYGHKEAPLAVQLDAVTFEHLRRSHGTRNVLSLLFPDSPTQTALIRHVQREPATGKILHVDFTRVSLRERINVRVPLRFVGEAAGVKIQGGVLLPLLEAVEVECRAGDIIDHADVDLSTLTEIDSTLHAKDVDLPKSYTLITDAEEPIVKIAAPRVEEPTVTEAEGGATVTAAPEGATSEE